MKISNGEINTGTGLIIKPTLLEQDFSKFIDKLFAEAFINNGDYRSYKIKNLTIEDTRFLVIVSFFSGYLIEVHMHFIDNDNESWIDYSSEAEKIKKKKNDDWLKIHLASPPPYLFTWGTIESVFDAKAGMSFILLRYLNK